MNNVRKSEYETRDSIMKLLSDDEIARVSTAETAVRLADGDEYLDMGNFDGGVQRAMGMTPMGSVLLKKAVREETWKAILAQLASGAEQGHPQK